MKKIWKKVLSVAVTASILAVSVFGSTSAFADINYGDVNFDGEINSTDKELIIEEILSDGDTLDSNQKKAADLGFGTITALNALLVLQKTVNSEYTFPNGDVLEGVDPIADTTVFVVGDSTGCDYAATADSNYYYKRVGFGTVLSNYLDSAATVRNLALSGRSSKSFLTESNYTTLCDEIDEGDYLIIAFGHNDEKSGNTTFTDANGDITDPTSFKYSLYENYIKVAEAKGATPILCTPVVRRSTSTTWSNNSLHITDNGDYAEAIRELGTEVGVDVIDNTTLTKELYTELTPDETLYLHAWTSSEETSVDNTHLNNYGANWVAYLMANDVKNSDSTLSAYVKENITAPNKDECLVVNPDYVEPEETDDYNLGENLVFTTTSPWNATVFGDMGGQGKLFAVDDEGNYLEDTLALDTNGSGFTYYSIADETNPTETTVGSIRVRAGIPDTSTAVGKIASGSDGLAMYYREGVDAGTNFKISATANVNGVLINNQVAFGVIVADTIEVNKYNAISYPYVAAGIMATSPATYGFCRSSDTTLNKLSTSDVTLEAGMSVDLEIVKVGNKYTITVGDVVNEYEAEYSGLVFPGVFAARCADVTFTNIEYSNEVTE